ncbi:MAG: anti-sigma factor [Alphaproteobacteria bacterium]|nr:anti-sigma factor [Alphaproteobacteria bacterium]
MNETLRTRDCDKVLLVQAEFDGELDAAEAATLAAHRQHCPACQAAAAALQRARLLMDGGLYEPAPDDVRRRVMARLAAAQPPAPAPLWALRSRMRAWWSAGIGFGLGAACAAALALLIIAPSGPDPTQELVASHIRALQPGHLEDVVSTDRHTVKPWFDGRLDFAPPVKDLKNEGFPLKGGRLDYVDGRPVAALVYQRDKHIIDLYIWPGVLVGGRLPPTAEYHGYNIVHWRWGGMTFWAVSDVEPAQLSDFAQAWQRAL